MKITSLHPNGGMPSRIKAGFSLIETMLAMGVAAVAITTILGLMPQGLDNVRQAATLQAEANITRHLLGSLSQAPWKSARGSDLLTQRFHEKRFYFDDQGTEIPADLVRDSAELAYVAEVKLPVQDVILSSSGAESAPALLPDPYLRRVIVSVANVADPDFDFQNGPRLAYREHTNLIAQAGR